MAKDAFDRELTVGDIVIISSTSYAQLHIGLVVTVNKNATTFMVGADLKSIHRERIGSTARLAIVTDHFLYTLDPKYAELLKTAQLVIQRGKGAIFKGGPGYWHSLTLDQLRLALL